MDMSKSSLESNIEWYHMQSGLWFKHFNSFQHMGYWSKSWINKIFYKNSFFLNIEFKSTFFGNKKVDKHASRSLENLC